jgi:hypothetical protein
MIPGAAVGQQAAPWCHDRCSKLLLRVVVDSLEQKFAGTRAENVTVETFSAQRSKIKKSKKTSKYKYNKHSNFLKIP